MECGQGCVSIRTWSQPTAISYDHLVPGQLPNWWNAAQYGISENSIAHTDCVLLWALITTAEALNHASITDPYGLYQHIHPSEIEMSLGSGMGGIVQKSLG
jgi:3-oxoacyl-(acyl-carrier-protein) synthase